MIGLNDLNAEIVIIHFFLSILLFVCSNSMGIILY